MFGVLTHGMGIIKSSLSLFKIGLNLVKVTKQKRGSASEGALLVVTTLALGSHGGEPGAFS